MDQEQPSSASSETGRRTETTATDEGLLHKTQIATGTSLTRFLISMAPVMVSLPGAELTSIEQPIILQVLKNKVNSLREEEQIEEKIQGDSRARNNFSIDIKEQQLPNNDLHTNNLSVNNTNNLVSNSVNKSQLVDSQTYRPQTSNTSLSSSSSNSPLPRRASTPPTIQNVLDIESHLIETFDGYPNNEDEGVGIKELTPIDDELRSGTSKIERSNNVRTIIEVQPAGVVIKKPIENIHLEPSQSALVIVTALNKDKSIQSEEIEEAAEILVEDIANEAIDNYQRTHISNEIVNEIGKEEANNIPDFSAKTHEELISLEYPQNKTDLTEDYDIKHSQKQKTETQVIKVDNSLSSDLTYVVNQQLSEVTSILDSQSRLKKPAKQNGHICNQLELDCNVTDIKVVSVPSPKTRSEEEERKLFIDSLPQIQTARDADDIAQKLALDCKKEYYQSLKKYLIQNSTEKPPVPLQTYRWEDLRRAKERGGYPWTHLYKRPLGPDEEPEILLMLRKSQEIRFISESPKSIKKVRIDEQVTVKETERYLQELSEDEEDEHHSEQHLSTQLPEDLENHSLHSESFSCISDSVLATGKPKKSNRFSKVRRLFRRRRYGLRPNEDVQSLPDTFSETSRQHSLEQVTATQPTPPTGTASIYEAVKANRCFPIMKKLKNMADRQKKRLHIKRIALGKDEKIVLNEETKILKLKNSPKSQRSDIPHFIEKQDSDDILEIVELDESPSRKRKDDGRDDNEIGNGDLNNIKTLSSSSLVKPEEIIEITNFMAEKNETTMSSAAPPKKAPRLRRDHVYEEIDHPDFPAQEFNLILDATSVEALKLSLVTQDNSALKEVSTTTNIIPLDRMGSSEEDQIILADQQGTDGAKSSTNLLAPISSIDSTSSDEDRNKKQLQPVLEEESDQPEDDQHSLQQMQVVIDQTMELKPPAIRKEASPAPSEKKVTFSYVEDEAEPHREDIELSPEHIEATKEANKRKAAAAAAAINDHEYEPIGEPSKEEDTFDKTIHAQASGEQTQQTTMEAMKQAEDVQKEMEEHFFKTAAPTPDMEIEVDTSEVGDHVLDKPSKLEKKSFIASAQDRTRKMQAGLRNQAGKLRTKLRPTVKKAPSGSPKAKDRKRFKAPEFSKMKMPDIKRPDISRFKDFKRPEFTKFSKPDMSKFKLPEKISTMKLKRSKSLKENESEGALQEENMVDENREVVHKNEPIAHQKKLFNFSNFGTYPRALRKKKKPTEIESSVGTATATEATSVVPSTETQPSIESSSSPQGDRGPGPVRSRWADKFSDVSYNDSEGSRYRRYGSELESFDRESSLERRRDENEDTGSEEPTLGILGGVTDNKQFADFDEENRAIHEISNLRSGEFKRRPIVHQDSDLRSDDSKEAIGWTDKDIEKNTLLRKAEIEAEASFLKYQPEDAVTQETQSTASSGKKLVLEEIDENEFFLRKRGVSEDNNEIRQYISNAIREGYDMPVNSLERVGEPSSYGDYEVPPPKPRRLHQSYAPENVSQAFHTPRDDYGDNMSLSQNGSDFFVAPKPPTRKFKGRSKYSLESQEAFIDDEQSNQLPYFDNDEEYLRPPSLSYKERDEILNDLNMSEKENIPLTVPMGDEVDSSVKPQPPKRQKRRREISLEKDSYINGFSGRSVSNSFLQQPEDVIVYRTEHEYHHIPLATPEKYFDSVSTIRKSISNYSNYDDRTSRGAISLEQTQYTPNERDRYLIDMNENDGYAVVRKDQVPKPTPPTRRKKFARLPGERFATMPNMRTKRSTSPPQRPPPPKAYTPATNFQTVTVRKSAHSLDAQPNYEDDYEEPGESIRPDSPRNLHSGEVINKMKYRPLPPPPRPPREKRQRSETRESELVTDYQMNGEEQFETSGQESRDDEIIQYTEEVEASTQTDPLPDDFVCEEFEITDDMKIIEPRIRTKTLEEVLRDEIGDEPEVQHQVIDSEQLSKGLQRFRDANQRSLSERSRASSVADRSKSHSRPQTPSAIVVERQLSTPVQQEDNETMVQASLVVRPVDDLELEEEQLRQDGLLTDSSQRSVSETKDDLHLTVSEASYAPSSAELDDVLGIQASDQETQQTDEEVERTLQRYRDELDEIGRQLMETAMAHELSPTPFREQIKEISDTDEIPSVEDTHLTTIKETWELSDSEPLRSDEESKMDSKGDLRSTTTLSELKPVESSGDEITLAEMAPQPPPRRKSNVTEQLSLEETTALQRIDNLELSTSQSLINREKESMLDLPCRVKDLEVELLRVNALQAGQIMVSQLHGTQITSEELECKSGNLIVKNIELPPGFIEDIVERVRKTEQSQLYSAEAKANLEGSYEKSSSPLRETLPPPKPPRLRDFEISTVSKSTEITKEIKESIQNADEGTQTEPLIEPSALQQTAVPPIFPSAEYLHSLAPLAFYNLHRPGSSPGVAESFEMPRPHYHRDRHRYQHRRSVSESEVEEDLIAEKDENELPQQKPRRRTRSAHDFSDDHDDESVAKAGRKFIALCSLSLAKIINQLTDYLRNSAANEEGQLEQQQQQPTDARNKQVPALVVLFIVITFAIIIFLVTGRNIHTHHWDYFNPPGHEGRQS
ncbi:uncharacterized protein ACN427_003652 isoform 1-T6 [Glossina fuscipes fuscipes]